MEQHVRKYLDKIVRGTYHLTLREKCCILLVSNQQYFTALVIRKTLKTYFNLGLLITNQKGFYDYWVEAADENGNVDYGNGTPHQTIS
jgi:hypothetical protein